jgi:hypothetical protein
VEARDVGPLAGLYYPFTLPLSDETLARALQIFDKVLFIDPLTPRVRAGWYDELAHMPYLPLDAVRWQRQDWEASSRTLEPLISAGTVEYLDPTPLLDDEPTHQAMTASLQSDMARDETFALFAASPVGWCVLRSRIPRSTFPFLHHQHSARVFSGSNIHRPFSSEHGFHALFADGKPDQEFGLPPYPGSRPEVDDEYACVVPYYLGSSLAVSLMLAVCASSDVIPFTDSPVHASLLKMRLAANSTNSVGPVSGTHDQDLDLRAKLVDARREVGDTPQFVHLEIEPVAREFAPVGHNLQLHPRI